MSETVVLEDPLVTVEVIPEKTKGRKPGKRKAVTDPDAPCEVYWEYVTPELAASYLEKPARNRRLSASFVRLYRRQMETGSWYNFHPQTITLDPDSRALNGQHRLHALVQSGKSYWMLVVRYKSGLFPTKIAQTFDRGKPRTPADILGIGVAGTPVTTRRASLTRYMFFGMRPSTTAIDDEQLVDFYESYADIINRVDALFPQRRRDISRPPLMAACARAWATFHPVPDDVVERFVDLLKGGFSASAHEHVVISFRNWVGKIPTRGSSGGNIAHAIYARAAYALDAFNHKKDVKRSAEIQYEPFPLKEDPLPPRELSPDQLALVSALEVPESDTPTTC